jgi:translocation-and-assembly-module (TAM) inner membrane subunit TamB-like protein
VPGENYRVTLRASGPPNRLRNFELSSDPPLPEADVLALVFSNIAPGQELGQYRTDITPQQQLIRDRAFTTLTGTLSSEVSRVAEKTLGTTVQITPSLSDPNNLSARLEPGARVTVFKRVSDKLSLTYSRSLTSSTRDQVILLEYDQTDQFSWTLSRNEDGTYALDWQVRRTF